MFSSLCVGNRSFHLLRQKKQTEKRIVQTTNLKLLAHTYALVKHKNKTGKHWEAFRYTIRARKIIVRLHRYDQLIIELCCSQMEWNSTHDKMKNKSVTK